jgi:diguanylate cyclase (GGDEF)-like protein
MKKTEDYLKNRYEYWKGAVQFTVLACSIGSIVWILKDLLLSNATSLKLSLLCRGIPTLFLIVYLTCKSYKNFLRLATAHIWLSIIGVGFLYTFDKNLITSGGGWLTFLALFYMLGIVSSITYTVVNSTVLIVYLTVIYSLYPNSISISLGEFFFTMAVTSLVFSISSLHTASLYKKTYDSQKMLYDLSYTDQLTGAKNRRIIQEITKNSKALDNYVLYVIDVDNFKKFNDMYGHDIGDSCLLKVVSSLQIVFNKPKDIVIRFGGDEFLVLSQGFNDVKAIYSSLIDQLNIDNDYNITLSIGTTKVYKGEDVYTSIKRADIALYKVKELGRNSIQIFEELDELKTIS